MKKFRQRILEMKEGFLDAKLEKINEVFLVVNQITISFIAWLICCISTIFIAVNLDYIFYVVTVISFLGFLIFSINHRAFSLVMPLSAKILLYFGRYGRVVTKKDWARIKKECPKGYKEIWSKNSMGHCYFYSWFIALFLKNAELMYCSIIAEDGTDTAHAVIVKNNCVYDTNGRQHFDLEEYKKMFGVKVYKMFCEKEYRTNQFFENIREDFVKWCAENKIYCDPQ